LASDLPRIACLKVFAAEQGESRISSIPWFQVPQCPQQQAQLLHLLCLQAMVHLACLHPRSTLAALSTLRGETLTTAAASAAALRG